MGLDYLVQVNPLAKVHKLMMRVETVILLVWPVRDYLLEPLLHCT